MKRVICKKEYDTETSSLIKKVCVGEFGDPEGYEENLYKTCSGSYFIHAIGGEQSPYPTETIKRISQASADKWLESSH